MLVLLAKWGFRLLTASAIRSVLYPDRFTVYDIRVCEELNDFHTLGDTKWSTEAWSEYQHLINAVRASAPARFSLRDCDRWFWGRNKMIKMLHGARNRPPQTSRDFPASPRICGGISGQVAFLGSVDPEARPYLTACSWVPKPSPFL